MVKKVHLIETETGHLCLCNDRGEILGPQDDVTIRESIDDMVYVTVRFAIAPLELMYKEKNEYSD